MFCIFKRINTSLNKQIRNNIISLKVCFCLTIYTKLFGKFFNFLLLSLWLDNPLFFHISFSLLQCKDTNFLINKSYHYQLYQKKRNLILKLCFSKSFLCFVKLYLCFSSD